MFPSSCVLTKFQNPRMFPKFDYNHDKTVIIPAIRYTNHIQKTQQKSSNIIKNHQKSSKIPEFWAPLTFFFNFCFSSSASIAAVCMAWANFHQDRSGTQKHVDLISVHDPCCFELLFLYVLWFMMSNLMVVIQVAPWHQVSLHGWNLCSRIKRLTVGRCICQSFLLA